MEFAEFPSLADLRKQTTNPELLNAFEYSGVALSRRVRQAAALLGESGFVTGHIHNKVKHGCLFVDDPEIMRDYYSYGDNWQAEDRENRVYVIPRVKFDKSSGQSRMDRPPAVLDATEEFAHKFVVNTRELCRSAREIIAMSIELNKLGLLW